MTVRDFRSRKEATLSGGSKPFLKYKSHVERTRNSLQSWWYVRFDEKRMKFLIHISLKSSVQYSSENDPSKAH